MGETRVFSTNDAGITGYPYASFPSLAKKQNKNKHMQKQQNPYLILYTKINSKWVIDMHKYKLKLYNF